MTMFDDNGDFALTLPLPSPIKLSAGIELHVTPGHENDNHTREMIQHIAEHVDRGNNLRAIESNLPYFEVHSDDESTEEWIDTVLEMAGWISNMTNHTVADKVRFLRHLLPMLPDADIVNVCETVRFYADRILDLHRNELGVYTGPSRCEVTAVAS